MIYPYSYTFILASEKNIKNCNGLTVGEALDEV